VAISLEEEVWGRLALTMKKYTAVEKEEALIDRVKWGVVPGGGLSFHRETSNQPSKVAIRVSPRGGTKRE